MLYFENAKLVFNSITSFIYKNIKVFLNISGMYFIWIFLHFFASQLYVKMCVPNTFIGFISSPFYTLTPHCQGLRWLVYNGANAINNMWVFIGTYICSYILIIKENTK